jgi:hypothetical protein
MVSRWAAVHWRPCADDVAGGWCRHQSCDSRRHRHSNISGKMLREGRIELSPPRAARLSNVTLCPCGCWKNFLCCPNHARMVNRFPPRACAPSVRYRASVPAVAQRGCWLCETNEDLVAEADHLDPCLYSRSKIHPATAAVTAPSPHLSSSSIFWGKAGWCPQDKCAIIVYGFPL